MKTREEIEKKIEELEDLIFKTSKEKTSTRKDKDVNLLVVKFYTNQMEALKWVLSN